MEIFTFYDTKLRCRIREDRDCNFLFITVRNKKYIVLKILSAVFYAVITAFMVILFVDALIDSKENGFVVLGYILILVTIGLSYLLPLILSVIGLILSSVAKSRGESKMGTVIYFLVFTCLPVVSWFVFLILTKVLGN